MSLTNITNKRISCPTVERKLYLFWQHPDHPERNLCIGEIIEQENDAGENMFLYNINREGWNDFEKENVDVAGIDVKRESNPIIRSGGLPFFFAGRLPPKGRGNIGYTYRRLQIDYYDPFEMVMRSRGLSQHDYCYTGRTPTDFIDRNYYYNINPMAITDIVPNLPCGNPENEFHKIID